MNLIKLFHYLTLNSMRCPAYAPKLRTNPCDTDVLYISYVSQLNSGMASVSSGTVHITSPLSSKQNNVLGVILQHTLKYFKYTALKNYLHFYYRMLCCCSGPYSPLYSGLFRITRLRTATHNLKQNITQSDSSLLPMNNIPCTSNYDSRWTRYAHSIANYNITTQSSTSWPFFSRLKLPLYTRLSFLFV